MSTVPTGSDPKILRKMGISENQVFTPKWKFVKISEMFFVLLKTINYDKQNIAPMFSFGIKDKKIKSEKDNNPLKGEICHYSDETNVSTSRKCSVRFCQKWSVPFIL